MISIRYYVYDQGQIVFDRAMDVRTQSNDMALAVGLRLARKKFKELGIARNWAGTVYQVEITGEAA